MPKDKKKIAAKLLLSLLLLTVIIIGGLALVDEILFRYALLFAGGQALLTVIVRSISLHNDLSAITLDPIRGKKSSDFKNTFRKIKLHSEIAAGIAIASLMINVYKSGIEFDQLNIRARLHYANEASALFQKLTSSNCELEAIDVRKDACKEITNSFNLISHSFVYGDVVETDIKKESKSINNNLDYFAMRSDEEAVLEIRALVSRFSIEMGHIYKLLSFLLPLLLLLTSTFAISGKVAVVLFDARENNEIAPPILFPMPLRKLVQFTKTTLHPRVIGHKIRVYFLCRC